LKACNEACIIRKECFVAGQRQIAMSCGKKTNPPFSSANDDPVVRKQIFQFEAQQIRCGPSWLSESKLSVLCNSPKGRVLRSEWLIHLFHL